MKLPQKIFDDIPLYRESLKKFLAGEINDSFFKGIRVPWGFYSQRGGKLLMARLRIPAGILTPEQLKHISIASKKFADGSLHITTRQDIQIHNVPFENSIYIIDYLKDFGISPRGGGGNTIRNITSCHLSGICPHEHREVYKYAWALTHYYLSLDVSYRLPRKIKIAFSGCERDCAYAAINDIGVVASKDGFKVLCAGGLGAKSAVGKVLEQCVNADDIGYITRAIINVFNKYGDRKNRHRNRLRFFVHDLGWKKFLSLYHEALEEIQKNEKIILNIESTLPQLPELQKTQQPHRSQIRKKGFDLFTKTSTGRQKQDGYSYAILRIPTGDIDASCLTLLSELGHWLPGILFRTTHRQSLLIANIPSEKLPLVYERIRPALTKLPYQFSPVDIVCCKGATTCNLGICNAPGLTLQIIERMNNEIDLSPDTAGDIHVNINGCPNACGHHPIGTISFSGIARRFNSRSVPFYKVYLGGLTQVENTRLAEQIGMVPAYSVPDLFSAFIKKIQDREEPDIYHYILGKGKEDMNDLIKKYANVPPYEENKHYYSDFGRGEDFSLRGLSQGECGSGVIDMIESDLDSAKILLTNAKEKQLHLDTIATALVHAARALLVVKGVEPKDEKELFSSFTENFIHTGICDPAFVNIYETYEKIVSQSIEKEEAYTYTSSLFKEVKEAYELMDPTFSFAVRYKEKVEPKRIIPARETLTIYDLRGTPCPMNYVKAKLKLEELNKGDCMEIYLDDGEPIENVPKSLENDGQEIVKIQRKDNFYRVTVKKRA